jgi:hypothetical protein
MSYKLTHLSDLVVHSTERNADLDITVAAVVGCGLQLQILKKKNITQYDEMKVRQL